MFMPQDFTYRKPILPSGSLKTFFFFLSSQISIQKCKKTKMNCIHKDENNENVWDGSAASEFIRD